MKFLITIILSLFIVSCSIFKGSEKDENITDEKVEDVYVFDEVTDTKNEQEDTKELNEKVDSLLVDNAEKAKQNTNDVDEELSKTYDGDVFYLQLGAFTTLERAEQFKNKVDSKVPFKLSIIFNTKNSLYTVRSSPFSTKQEVQEIKDEFWKKNMFLDAFIVSE